MFSNRISFFQSILNKVMIMMIIIMNIIIIIIIIIIITIIITTKDDFIFEENVFNVRLVNKT